MNPHLPAALLAAIVLPLPGTAPRADANTGLLLHWGFECGAGLTVCDQSGNGHTGTVFNGAHYVAAGSGRVGGGAAYWFDGIDDVIAGVSLGYVPVGTISFWMNADVVENWRNPLSTSYASWDDNIRFEESASGTFTVGALGLAPPNAAWTLTETLQAERWYHVSFAWDHSQTYGYLDGTPVFTAAQPDPANAWRTSTLTFDNIAVGNGYSSAAERHWQGYVDDVRIYDRVLTTQEIAWLATEAGPGEYQPGGDRWIGGAGGTVAGGEFADATGWSPTGRAPARGDTALFDLPTTYEVSVSASVDLGGGMLSVQRGDLTLALAPGSQFNSATAEVAPIGPESAALTYAGGTVTHQDLRIGGAPPTSTATLTLTGADTTLQVQTLSLARDTEDNGRTGTLNLADGAHLTWQGNFTVGGTGARAAINVSGGAELVGTAAYGRLELGLGTGNQVDLNVSGTGSRLALTGSEAGTLVFGSSDSVHGVGVGTAVIAAGGRLSVDTLGIVNGTVTTTGVGSLAQAREVWVDTMPDAQPGTSAELRIADGGRLEAEQVTVGGFGTGTLSFSGLGTSAQIGELWLGTNPWGDTGTATLNVADGAQLTWQDGFTIGGNGARVAINVTGGGTIDNAASHPYLWFGGDAGNQLDLTVSGPGSRIDATNGDLGALIFGVKPGSQDGGVTTATIADGGLLTADALDVRSGAVTVTGASSLAQAREVWVGSMLDTVPTTPAVLHIADGARLEAAQVMVGGGGNGTLTFSGPGAGAQIDQLWLGTNQWGAVGTGTLNVTDGAQLTWQDGFTIGGNGARVAINVTGGGVIDSDGSIPYLWFGGAADNQLDLTVSGPGSRIDATGSAWGGLIFGSDPYHSQDGGVTTATIADGGLLAAGHLEINSGTVTVTGAGSLAQAGEVWVGSMLDNLPSTPAVLRIADGARLEAAQVTVGSDGTGSGTLTVSGVGTSAQLDRLWLGTTQWGAVGTGTLTVADEAQVTLVEGYAPGGNGQALTRIESGGRLKALSQVTLEAQDQGSTTMKVAGSGSVLDATGYLVRVGGNGLLHLSDGGTVRASAVEVMEHGLLSGSGTIAADLVLAGTLSPGQSPGVLEVAGDFGLLDTGLLQIEIGGRTPGSDYDLIAVAGNLFLAGTLAITFVDDFVPAPGDAFAFLTFAGSRTGTFTRTLLSGYVGAWDLVWDDHRLLLVAATPLPSSLWLFGIGLAVVLRRRAGAGATAAGVHAPGPPA